MAGAAIWNDAEANDSGASGGSGWRLIRKLDTEKERRSQGAPFFGSLGIFGSAARWERRYTWVPDSCPTDGIRVLPLPSRFSPPFIPVQYWRVARREGRRPRGNDENRV